MVRSSLEKKSWSFFASKRIFVACCFYFSDIWAKSGRSSAMVFYSNGSNIRARGFRNDGILGLSLIHPVEKYDDSWDKQTMDRKNSYRGYSRNL